MTTMRWLWTLAALGLLACGSPTVTGDGSPEGSTIDVVQEDMVAPSEAGMDAQQEASPDPCALLTTCGTCAGTAGCGFCLGTGACLRGTSSGSTDGTCTGGNWAASAAACVLDSGAEGGDGGPTCASGLTSCSGVCVDTQSDPANCAACGTACPSGQTCAAGACGVPCPGTQLRCGGVCIDGSANNANCGACGRACAAMEHCAMSSCVPDCAAAQTACAGACVDTRTDVRNCGLCGTACAVTERCAAGLCVPLCPAGQSSCGGVCVDTQTNNTNCGACGTSCPSGQSCSGGLCRSTCAAPTQLCGGVCVDVASSANNCGACGTVCPAAANASPACAASACTLLCASGFSDCDGQAANGCEVNLATSLTSCGACGRVCAAGANQQAQCSSGACQRSCTAGFGNCDGQAANGCEANLATTVTQCGACGRVCAAPVGGTATCVAGACGGACAAGQTVCGATGGSAGRCVSLQADAANCGACGNACPSGQSCVAGACRMLCPSGQTACGSTMSCVDLATSAANCGFCGRACASGESCVFGTCLAPFRLGTLATTGCNVVNNEAVNGDQRGNVTVGATRVLVNADNGTGTFDGANVAAAPSMVPTYLDGAVYDTFSGELYLLGDGAGPVRFGTGTRNVDRLWRTQSGVWIVNAPRLLSRSIALDTNGTGVGVYSGGNRAVVHTSNVYSINLTTGAVTDLGAMPQPPRTGAENFRSTGIAEYSGTTLYLTYIQSASTIARVRVPDGLVTSVGSFANLGDAAHLAVYSNGAASRWLLRVEGVSQFGLVAEALVSCPVTVAQNVTTGQFTVGGYAVAGCTVVDTNPLVGDDRGPLAVSYGQVFIAGDAGSARYAAASPAASNGLAVGQFGDHLLYNVRDGALFGLYSGAVPLQSSQGLVTVDRIVPLNESSLQPSGAALTLSQPLVVNTSAYSNVMLFNGWDRSVLVTNGHAWNINLDNGDVRDFGAAVLPAHIAAEQWAAVGIAETTGSATDLVFVESATRISRMRLGTGTLGSVLSLTNLGDTNSLGFSRARGRWYWQTEGTNQFTPATFAEYVGGCPGTFSN